MAPKRTKSGITNAILLQHIQGLGYSLRMEMKNTEQQLRKEIASTEERLRKEIGSAEFRLSERLENLKTGVRWIQLAMENTNVRLDDIEVKELPKIKKAIGIR